MNFVKYKKISKVGLFASSKQLTLHLEDRQDCSLRSRFPNESLLRLLVAFSSLSGALGVGLVDCLKIICLRYAYHILQVYYEVLISYPSFGYLTFASYFPSAYLRRVLLRSKRERAEMSKTMLSLSRFPAQLQLLTN